MTTAVVVKGALDGVISLASILAKDGVSATGKALFAKVFSTKQDTLNRSPHGIEQALSAISPTDSEADAVKAFVRSETFHNLLRSFTALAKSSNRKALFVQAEALLQYLDSIFPGRPIGVLQPLADELVLMCSSIIEDSWETAIHTEVLLRGWEVESAAQAIIADEFDSLNYQSQQLQKVSAKSLADLDGFLARYRKQVSQRHSKLRPQTLHEIMEIAIDKLYIAPSLTKLGGHSDPSQSREDMLTSAYRVVLLGNPGGGKSTFAAKLCFDLCNRYDDRLYAGRKLTPISITIREFARHKKEHPCSILEFIELQARSDYQLADVPDDAFLLLLLNGHALVVFDGLDELTETQDRINVKLAVEHFASQYPSVPILVTSREIGYEQAPLDRTRFVSFKLAPFNEAQVSAYVTTWFNLARHGSDEEKERLANAFIRESAVVPDIRTNPLMLGLLCNLYRQDGYIPNNRPEVYQRCADLLFTKWDRHRGIIVHLPMAHKLRPAMGYLASWIYSKQSLQDGVTERQLVKATADYLSAWKEERDEAESVAQQFVDFFKGRAWVFSDTGSNKSESLYQFTHRTFLEYFTAEHLVKSFPTADSIHDHLLPHVRRREWDVVCQLAYQMNAQRTESHDVLVTKLLDDAEEYPIIEKLGMLSFCARSLDLLYPTPLIRRRAVSTCLRFLFCNVAEIRASAPESTGMSTAIAQALLNTHEETRKIHETEFSLATSWVINEEVHDDATKAGGILMALQCPLLLHDVGNIELVDRWTGIADQVVSACRDQVRAVSLSRPELASIAWIECEVSIGELAAHHGRSVVMTATHYPLGWLTVSIAETSARSFLENNEPDSREKDWIKGQSGELLDSMVEGLPFRHSMTVGLFSSMNTQLRGAARYWPESATQRAIILLYGALESESDRYANVDVSGMRDSFRREFLTFATSRFKVRLRTTAIRIVEKYVEDDRARRALIEWVMGRQSFWLPSSSEELEGDEVVVINVAT